MAGEPTPIFDVNLHPEGLSDQDLESMRLFGVRAALVPAHHFPQPTPRALREHFDDIVGRQLPRLERAGIRAFAALGVHPLSLPRRGLAEVLTALPGYFRGGKVVAVGAVGLSRASAAEEEALLEQVALARRLKLPVCVYTPHDEKDRVTRRILSLLRASALPPSRVLVDGASGRTVRPILACGHRAALTLHPEELSAERAVAHVRRLGAERLSIDSGAGAGAGDILALPRLVRLLERANLSQRLIDQVAYANAARWLGISS
jgi:predicted metal-dependent TIM-barrel fold hydrolase